MSALACSNADCALVGQPVAAAVAEALGGKCPTCKGPLESPGSGLSETSDRVIATYPYPVALPLQLLAGKTDVEARAKSLVDVLTNALKFQAMVVQSEYLRSDLVDEDLTAIIRKDLGRPLVSAWVKFVEAAVPRMEAAGVEPFVADLGPAYARAETKRKKGEQIDVPGKGYHDEEGEFVETKAKLGLVRALINYRNKFAHGFNQPEEESREELDFYMGVLDQLLDELSWMADHTLLKREDGKVWRMMGAEPEAVDMEWPEQAGDTGLALLSPDGARVLPLFPLFIVPREYVAETKAGEDLLVYDQDTGKRIVYVSPRGHHREIQGTLRPWRKLVAAKEVVLPELTAAELSPEELGRRGALVTRDVEEALLASRKLLKGVYVSRPDAEMHLRPLPGTAFPLALVTAQAGAGKTTLLHHMAGEWAEANASVVFTRAMSIEGTDVLAWLRKELRLAASVTSKDLAHRGASEERPLLLVIDGLNEHGEREALLASLLEFAGEVREARHLKVLVSWRAEYADWAAAAKDHASSFLPGPEGKSDDDSAPSLHLGPWAHTEVASLWKRLGASDKKRFVPRFTHDDVYRTSRSLADLLKNPLLLRLLLETFHGRGLPEDVTRQGLFDAWMRRLRERTGDENKFMLDVARLLMESRSASVALDALYDDARTAKEARRTDVAAPFTRLLRREGVLTLVPGEPPLVAFAMDRYMERAAGAAVVEDGRGQEPGDLVALLEELGEHPLAEEIVESALSIRMREEGRDYLWHFIDALPEGSSSSAGRIAGDLLGRLIQQGEDADGLAAELISEPSESDLHAAMSAGTYLDRENEYQLLLDFLAGVAERASGAVLETEAMGDLLSTAASTAAMLNDWQRCREWNERALALQLRLLGEDHASVAMSYNNLGMLLLNLGENEQAREYCEKSLSVYLRLFGEEHANVGLGYSNLGLVLYRLGEYEQARDYFEKSLRINLRLCGEDHASVAMSYNNLGALLSDLGEYEQARDYYEKSLSVYLRLFGEEHANVATSYNNLGVLLLNLGENEQAREYCEKSLSVYLRLFGEEHADVALGYNNLGLLLSNLGENEQARDYYEKSLRIYLRLFGEDHASVAMSYNNLGMLLLNLGENEQAREYCEKSLSVYLRLFGEEHADVALGYNNLGLLLSNLGENEQARDYYEKSLRIYLRLFGEDHASVAMSYNNLGALLSDLGENEQAREYCEKSLSVYLRLFGEEHADVALGYNNLGLLLSNLGENEQARDYYEKSLRIYLRLFGEDHASVALGYNNLGVLLSNLGENEQAREYFEKSLRIKLQLFGEDHADVAAIRDLLGDVLVQLQLLDEARAQYEQAAAHGNGWSMWTLAQDDLDDVDSVDCAEQILAWVRGAAEFGVDEATEVLENVNGMEPMEAVARIRSLLNQDEGQ